MLWSDVNGNHVTNVTVTPNSSGKEYTLSYDCSGAEGNAMIAIYDTADPDATDAHILWSYHIWVSDRSEADDQSWSVINTTNRTIVPNKYYMTDRNLGATSNNVVSATDHSSYGLYYQCGRKDSFVGGVSYNSAVRKKQYTPSGTLNASFLPYQLIL